MSTSLRAAARPLVQALSVPYGFTLTIGASLALAVGRNGYPGWLPVWLFVVGGCAAYCAGAAVSRAHRGRDDGAGPLSGPAVFNLVPVAVVPLVELATVRIGPADAQFAVAGVLAVALYLLGISGLAALFRARGGPQRASTAPIPDPAPRSRPAGDTVSSSQEEP